MPALLLSCTLSFGAVTAGVECAGSWRRLEVMRLEATRGQVEWHLPTDRERLERAVAGARGAMTDFRLRKPLGE